MAATNTLALADYVIIGLMISISVSIGIYYRLTGGKQKTFEEYFAANRSMKAIPIAIALVVSFMSAITLLGVSAENYVFGSQFIIINFTYLLGIPLVCYGFLPVFYKLQATSVYEYLEKRFGVETRLLASLILWIQILLYSGVVLYAPAIAFETTSGLSRMASILSVGLACAFYSSIGGIKAVLITDIFQAVLMFASLIVVITTAAYSIGGLDKIWNIAEIGGRIEFDNFSLDPTTRHSWWSLGIGGLCTFLSLYGVNQVQIQRLLTINSLKSAQNAMWITWPILTALSFMTCFSGLAIYSNYFDCDPKTSGKIDTPDMLMPYYVMDTMSSKPGLAGLFIAGIFSAGLSTISAALNSLSAVSLEDYIKPFYHKCTKKQITTSTSLFLGKLIAFILGIACIALAILAQYFGNILQTSLTIFGVVGGPLLGLFTLGMLCKSATQRGALTGTICAVCFLIWIGLGQPRAKAKTLPVSIDGCNDTMLNINERIMKFSNTNNTLNFTQDDSNIFYLYRISYMWYSPIGCISTLFIGWVVSNISLYFRWEKQKNIHPDLFFPFISNRIEKLKKTESYKKYTFNIEDKSNVEITAI